MSLLDEISPWLREDQGIKGNEKHSSFKNPDMLVNTRYANNKTLRTWCNRREDRIHRLVKITGMKADRLKNRYNGYYTIGKSLMKTLTHAMRKIEEQEKNGL